MNKPEFWIQIGVTLIAAIAYFAVYKQQQPLLKRYKEGFEQIDKELNMYKELFSMESINTAIEHRIMIKTPEIEAAFKERIRNEGKGLIKEEAVVELAEQTLNVALWLYSYEKGNNDISISFKEYVIKRYPESQEYILWTQNYLDGSSEISTQEQV